MSSFKFSIKKAKKHFFLLAPNVTKITINVFIQHPLKQGYKLPYETQSSETTRKKTINNKIDKNHNIKIIKIQKLHQVMSLKLK